MNFEHLQAVPYTDTDIRSASKVRTRYGWYDVLAVNDRSVSVAGDFGDVRIPFGTVLEVAS